jgi:hypothetical protein
VLARLDGFDVRDDEYIDPSTVIFTVTGVTNNCAQAQPRASGFSGGASGSGRRTRANQGTSTNNTDPSRQVHRPGRPKDNVAPAPAPAPITIIPSDDKNIAPRTTARTYSRADVPSSTWRVTTSWLQGAAGARRSSNSHHKYEGFGSYVHHKKTSDGSSKSRQC